MTAPFYRAHRPRLQLLWQIEEQKFAARRTIHRKRQLALIADNGSVTFIEGVPIHLDIAAHNLNPCVPIRRQASFSASPEPSSET